MMTKCIRGVIPMKKGTTRENAIKRFKENALKVSVVVLRVIHAVYLEDGVWMITANVQAPVGVLGD